MSKSRDIADSAETINFIDGLTSDAQSQLDGKATLDASPTFTGTVTATAFSGDGSGLTGVDSLPSQTGNNGLFLTTDGTDASWEAVSAGLNFIQEVTASNNASVILSGFSTDYDSYQIEAVDVYGGNSATLRMTLTVDGSEVTSGYHSSVESRSAGASSTYIAASYNVGYFSVTNDVLGASSSSRMSTTMRIFGYTGYKSFIAHGLGNYGGNVNADAIGGHESSTGTLNSVKFFLSSGNIYGKFRLYGITKS
jgi:hypothetical protein